MKLASSRLAEAQRPHQLRSSAPCKAKSVSTAKVLRERVKRTDDERLPRFLETTTGPGPPASETDARPLGH